MTELDRLRAEITRHEKLRVKNMNLLVALAECRDAFGEIDKGIDVDLIDPLSVPDYVREQVQKLRDEIAQLKKNSEEHREKTLNAMASRLIQIIEKQLGVNFGSDYEAIERDGVVYVSSGYGTFFCAVNSQQNYRALLMYCPRAMHEVGRIPIGQFKPIHRLADMVKIYTEYVKRYAEEHKP